MAVVETVREHQVRTLRNLVERQRSECMETALALAADASTDRAAGAEVEFVLERISDLDARLAALPSVPGAKEPEIYGPSTGRSYFADVAAASHLPMPLRGVTAPEAQERLAELADYEASQRSLQSAEAQFRLGLYGVQPVGKAQSRALGIIPGSGGQFAPTRWIVDQWASIARGASCVRNLVTNLDLPDGCAELVIPRVTSAAGLTAPPAENVAPVETLETTDETRYPVFPIEGRVTMSQALFDRGGIFADQIVLAEMSAGFAEALQELCISGTGEGNQPLGWRNVPTASTDGVPGAKALTYTAASPSVAGLTEVIGQAAGDVSDSRLRPPNAIVCRGARWFAVSSKSDEQKEPVLRPGLGSTPTEMDLGPYGPWANLPVWMDNVGIPANLGAGKNQDEVLVVRGQDSLLLIDPGGPKFAAMPETDEAGQLSVVVTYHVWCAWLPDRHPESIARVGGTGLVVPSGY